MSNIKLAGLLAIAGMFMLGLAFASKPLYDAFCRVTGFGGTTQVAREAPDAVLDREFTVRFDANVNNAPLEFHPLQRSVPVQLGAHALAFFEVTNTSDQDVPVIAGYNVTPHKTGRFFNKLECFCFEERVIKAGETKKLPVVFFIDPDLDAERNLDDVRTITLSYTYFQTDTDLTATQTAALN